MIHSLNHNSKVKVTKKRSDQTKLLMGRIPLYLRKGISCYMIKNWGKYQLWSIFVEINLGHLKWLLLALINRKNHIATHLETITKSIGKLNTTYNKKYVWVILMLSWGKFKGTMVDFLYTYPNLTLRNKSTCFESPGKPPCVEVIITNYRKFFENTDVFF